MPLAIPPDLKKITAFIRRAEELDKDGAPESRVVAYYCRQYAVQQGIPLASTSAAAKTCLTHILNDLEAEKETMNAFTKQEAAYLCRSFAQKVFDRADLVDREGAANKDTAKTFYTAATFLQILEQFAGDGEDESAATEDRKRIVYAKWKATEILKALKEGRTPTPGGYGEEEPALDGDDDDKEEAKTEQPPSSQASSSDAASAVPSISPPPPPTDAPVVAPVKDDDADEEIIMPPPAPAPLPPPAMPPPPSPPPEEEGTEVGLHGVEQPPPPAYPGTASTGRSRPPASSFDLPPPPLPSPHHTPAPAPPVVPSPPPAPAPVAPPPPAATHRGGWFSGGNRSNGNTSNKLSKTQLADATELTRFALAALEDKNADLAAERLKSALQALGRR